MTVKILTRVKTLIKCVIIIVENRSLSTIYGEPYMLPIYPIYDISLNIIVSYGVVYKWHYIRYIHRQLLYKLLVCFLPMFSPRTDTILSG